jgi:hypothetical protein
MMFERLVAHLLLLCTSGLLQVVEKIVILDKALLNVKGHMYGRLKLFETVACLVELHVNAVSELLRYSYNQPDAISENFDVLVLYIRVGFVSAILGGKDFSLFAGLQSIVGYCTTFLNGQRPISVRIGGNNSSNLDLKIYFEMYQNSLVRRARELILSIDTRNIGTATAAPNALILGLVHAKTGDGANVAALIGQAYTTSSFYRKANSLQRVMFSSRSPLEIAVDDYYATSEESEPSSAARVKQLLELKAYSLSAVVVPTIASEDKLTAYFANKGRLFRFIQSILSQKQDHTVNDIQKAGMFEISLLCAIVKQIGVTLRDEVLCSSKNTVNDSLIEVIFGCGRSVLTLPADVVDPKSIGLFVDWACPSTASTNTTLSDYVWYVCNWIRNVGDMILRKSHGQLNMSRLGEIHNVRNASDPSGVDSLIWIPLGESDEHFESARRLNELEKCVFPRPLIHKPKFLKANKYVTGRAVTSNIANQSVAVSEQLSDGNNKIITFDEWVPSATLCSAVCQFNEKIQFAIPSRD